MATVKVACPFCGKIYKVAEDQLQKRTTCRECEQGFLLADAVVEEPAGNSNTSTEVQWYVEINGTQSGPFRRDRVLAMLECGQISGGSLVWREGMDTWQPLKSVTELASAAGGRAASHAAGAQKSAATDDARVERGPTTGAVGGGQARNKEAFFRCLFDFSFSQFVMMRLVPALYVLAMVVCAIIFLVIVVVVIAAGADNGLLALIGGIIIGPIGGALVAFLYLLLARLQLEIIVVVFRIAANTKTIAEHTGIIAEREKM